MSPGGCRLAQGDPKAGPLEGEGLAQADWLKLEQCPPRPQRAQLVFLLEDPGGQKDRMTTTLLREPRT